MSGFGRYVFRHRRTGHIATIVASSQERALKVHTPYPWAWEFLRFEEL